jgi:hypothetical protein
MQEFKIGDKVREIATGDEGVIECDHYYGEVRVTWATGAVVGSTTVVSRESIDLTSSFKSSNNITFQQVLDTLLELGYKVTLEKI